MGNAHSPPSSDEAAAGLLSTIPVMLPRRPSATLRARPRAGGGRRLKISFMLCWRVEMAVDISLCCAASCDSTRRKLLAGTFISQEANRSHELPLMLISLLQKAFVHAIYIYRLGVAFVITHTSPPCESFAHGPRYPVPPRNS